MDVGGFRALVTHVTSLLVVFYLGAVFLRSEKEKEMG